MHKPTLRWYVGSRTSKYANINDNYKSSSETVKQLIKNNPEEWERTIIATGTAADMYELETEILQLFDARRDIRSFNQHNNEGIHPVIAGKGNLGKKKSAEHSANISRGRMKIQKTLSIIGKSTWQDPEIREARLAPRRRPQNRICCIFCRKEGGYQTMFQRHVKNCVELNNR